MTGRGLFVGRFQPPHLGHMEVFRRISKAHSEFIVAVGSADESHTWENPFTAGERIWMIRESLKEEGLTNALVLPVPDIRRNSLWVSHVCSLVPPFTTVYTRNPLPRRLFEEKGFDVRTLELVRRDLYEGRRIRELMRSGGEWKARVPPAVVRIIEEIGGIERIRSLLESDRTPEQSGDDL